MLLSLVNISQNHEKFSVQVNLYQPISDIEKELLEEILVRQINYYLTNNATWTEDRITFNTSPKKVLSGLNSIVKHDVNFYGYKDLSDFKGFSSTVKKKIENITYRSFEIGSYDPEEEERLKQSQMQYELSGLLEIIRTELFVFGEKDSFIRTTEVFSGLTEQEKDSLISEIENFKEGDFLAPIELAYKELTAEDNSGIFIGEPGKQDLADKILDLLAENSQRLERLESELVQYQIGDGENSAVLQKDVDVMDKLPESMDFYFYSGSYRLTTATLLQLNEIVEILAQSESIKVVITGFTDNTGSVNRNLELSKNRAKAVKKFMRDSGMAEERFIINYFGESKSNEYSNEDRRVEIKFFL